MRPLQPSPSGKVRRTKTPSPKANRTFLSISQEAGPSGYQSDDVLEVRDGFELDEMSEDDLRTLERKILDARRKRHAKKQPKRMSGVSGEDGGGSHGPDGDARHGRSSTFLRWLLGMMTNRILLWWRLANPNLNPQMREGLRCLARGEEAWEGEVGDELAVVKVLCVLPLSSPCLRRRLWRWYRGSLRPAWSSRRPWPEVPLFTCKNNILLNLLYLSVFYSRGFTSGACNEWFQR